MNKMPRGFNENEALRAVQSATPRCPRVLSEAQSFSEFMDALTDISEGLPFRPSHVWLYPHVQSLLPLVLGLSKNKLFTGFIDAESEGVFLAKDANLLGYSKNLFVLHVEPVQEGRESVKSILGGFPGYKDMCFVHGVVRNRFVTAYPWRCLFG